MTEKLYIIKGMEEFKLKNKTVPPLYKLIFEAGMSHSLGEAKRWIMCQTVTLDDEIITNPMYTPEIKNRITISIGDNKHKIIKRK